jgi:hypothetical protein
MFSEGCLRRCRASLMALLEPTPGRELRASTAPWRVFEGYPFINLPKIALFSEKIFTFAG